MSTAPDNEPMQFNHEQSEATPVGEQSEAAFVGDRSDATPVVGRSEAASVGDRSDAIAADAVHHASLHADSAADALKDQLRKDVASWREGRSEGSTRQATDLSVAVARSIVPPTNARMKRAKPVAVEAKPTSTQKKPFGMSYDGTSRADYIKLMISRGAR